MATDAIELYLDLSTPQGALVRGLSDKTPLAFGPFYQGQLLKLRIFPVVPRGSVISTPFFSSVALDDLDVQVAIGPAAGTESILAAQYTWTKQTVPDSEGKSGYFYADVDLNTSAMNTAVGSSSTLDTQFEILMSRGASAFAAVYQQNIIVKAVVKGPGSAASVPTPAPAYLTADQCYSLFVMWNNQLRAGNAGRSVVLTSPDASHTREIGIDDNGIQIENLT